MTTALAKQEERAAPRSLAADVAEQYGMEPGKFIETIKATVFPSGNVTNEQLAAFLIVAKQYGLNPFIREIYAFPGRGSGIVPIVSIDGWTALINRQKNLDGIEFEDRMQDSKLVAITCRIFRKDRSKSTEVTEYLSECSKETEPWKKWPARMLRHKALIQCARYAFSLSGIYDEDEADRIESVRPQGRIELEVESPLREAAGKPVQEPASNGHANGKSDVYFQVDKHYTILSGNVYAIKDILPKIGGRPDNKTHVWTMPSARTHELVKACDEKGIHAIEVNANGSPVPQPGEDRPAEQPETLFQQ